MAFTFDVDALSTFVNETKNAIINEIVVTGDSVSRMDIQPGIKGTQTINLGVSSVTIQADACGWTPAGSTEFTQRNISVLPFKVNEQWCLKDIETYFMGQALKAGDITDYSVLGAGFVNDKVARIKKEIELSVWQGDIVSTPGFGHFNGLLYLLGLESDRETVELGSPNIMTGPFTTANIISAVEAMVMARPVEMLDAPGQYLNMSMANYLMYTSALRTADLYNYGQANNGAKYEIEIPGTGVIAKGVIGLGTSDKMVLTYNDNLVFGTDNLNGEEDFKIWFDDKEDAVMFKARFKAGVQVKFPQYCVCNF